MATRPKRPRDFNQLAKLIVDIAVGNAPPDTPTTKRQSASSKGGIKGGAERAKKLTAKQRSEIAKKAAQVRWKKVTEPVD